ncbi:MerR family transcriptional regulator [Actinopolymorpha pittospori]|uniref:DNA-binding transcriptional MerR regulator n=1 Tax=Actinopolymorpha pittospori TaxID=648752 RepID=A0A927RCW5_9ACTN|nr:MerR family transcriptional regulator [Actinopolymorpha pittospori]MBE1607500.1 DNA-binding transcriptional MerR regulator [Actinopolymorpha pittospori]
MNGDTLYSIGDLARRTGLSVKTIRFYSDRGIVPPTDRSPAGYRRYDINAVARLELIRTLRELGLDLPTIRKVVERKAPLHEVAAAHAEALRVQIRTLNLRQAVLTAVARRGSTPEEIDLMHKLARLSEDERRRLIDDFLDAAFGDLGAQPAFAGIMRSMTPELPDDPEPEQVEAWVELAELTQAPEFRDVMRRLAEHHAAEWGAERAREGRVRPDVTAAVRHHVGPAVTAGIDPLSTDADPVVAAVISEYAHAFGRLDAEPGSGAEADAGRLLAQLEAVNDPRRERYLELLAVINGWQAPAGPAVEFDWCIQALRARARR